MCGVSPYALAVLPSTSVSIVEHIDGNHQNHEVKNLRVVPDVKCEDCHAIIEPDRIRWFAINRKGQVPKVCGNCSFDRRANRSPSSR